MGLRGPQPGTGGRPRKSLAEKVTEGNPGKRKLKVLDFEQIATEPEGVDMPPPKEFLSAVQRDGSTLSARELYEEAWAWLKRRGCAELVSPALLERYAVSAARWIHCEEAVSKYGYLGKHPISSQPIQSPYVAMSQNYMKQTNRLWSEIFAIVRDNCSTEYKGVSPQDDLMERLLRSRRG